MLLTITSTSDRSQSPATDLGYLLHKHPERAQKFGLPVGTAHVFYPRADEQTCTAALLLEVDPIALVRGRGQHPADGFSLAQYVNDRPYAASSLLAVALGKVFRTAVAGRCDARPDLPATTLNLELHVPALPCRGGADLARRMFEPLGWHTEATAVPLDPELGWGDSAYLDLRLTGQTRLSDALSQLYVLLPVLDDAKHYWVSTDEVDKLIRAGEGWLAGHPERALITERYLRHQRRLVDEAAERLAGLEDTAPGQAEAEFPADLPADLPAEEPAEEQTGPTESNGPTEAGVPAGSDERRPPEGPAASGTGARPADTGDQQPEVPLRTRRIEAVLAVLADLPVRSVVDLGCGEGRLLAALLADPRYERLLGVDVSVRELRIAARRIGLERLPERARARIDLRQSSLVYTDPALSGFDAAVLAEVIEHVDPSRLPALALAVFGTAHPGTVVVTTPNAAYNPRYGMAGGQTRHPDHRFEWDQEQFRSWAEEVAGRYGYTVRIDPIGEPDPEAGPPTQMAVFTAQPDATAEVSR